jgi:hypothetical protein
MATIFALVNKINGKRLIGITETPLADRHLLFGVNAKRGCHDPVFKDIQAFGIDSFVILPLAEADGEDAIIMANEQIRENKGKCYNIKPITAYRRHRSADVKRRISDTNKITKALRLKI